MKNKRRDFIKLTGLTGLGIAGSGMISDLAATMDKQYKPNILSAVENKNMNAANLSVIGQYGDWASGLTVISPAPASRDPVRPA